MASITEDLNGYRRIQVVLPDGKRRAIHLGKVQQRDAQAIKVKVEALLSALVSGHPPADETARWLRDVNDRLYAKLAVAGLVPPRDSAMLRSLMEDYIAGRTDLKPNTILHLKRAQSHLLKFFDGRRQLRSITAADAEAYRISLIEKGMAPDSTVPRLIARARQFFTAAIKRKLITENPFAGISTGVTPDPARFYYVSLAEIAAVLDACPDAEWRLIVALCRFGGLRCPSEILGLTWADVDWANSKLHVPDEKRSRKGQRQIRVIPIFPELLPYLRDVFELAEEGAIHLITRYRVKNANLRTQMHRIIRRAGLEPWPKTFQNLRSTRETELADKFPLHVVCKWIGNSEPVAAKHYLQITDEHFERAIQGDQNDGEKVSGTAHKAAQQPSESGDFARQAHETSKTPSPETARASAGLPLDAEPCESSKVPPPGLEPGTR
jgi:integrase